MKEYDIETEAMTLPIDEWKACAIIIEGQHCIKHYILCLILHILIGTFAHSKQYGDVQILSPWISTDAIVCRPDVRLYKDNVCLINTTSAK